MATYSNNTTIKIDSKINLSASSTYPAAPASSSYTVPANKYLAFQVDSSASGTGGTSSVSIDGVTVVSSSSSSTSNRVFNVKAGPGCVVTVSANNGSVPGSSGSASLHGVLFSNTP